MERPLNGRTVVSCLYVPKQLDSGTRLYYTDALNDVSAPVLVLHGSDDLQTEDASRVYVDAFPNAQFQVIQDATHFPFVEEPEQFATVVAEFLEER